MSPTLLGVVPVNGTPEKTKADVYETSAFYESRTFIRTTFTMETTTPTADVASNYTLASKWSDSQTEVFVTLEAVEKLLQLDIGMTGALALVRVALSQLRNCNASEKLLFALYDNVGSEVH